jgi:hypothetical protein
MRSRAIFLLLSLALAGCGTTFPAAATRDADQRAQAIFADCEAQRLSGVLRSYRQAAECARPRVLAAYQQSGYPYIDLVELDLAARATGADRIDTGYASAADVTRDIAELDRRIADERQRRRDGEMRLGGSAPYVPPQELLAGLDSLTGRDVPRSGANCFAVGSFSHCN